MPLNLPNGEVIYNVTSHILNIWHENKLYTVASDGVVYAKPESTILEKHDNYLVVQMNYLPMEAGELLIKRIKRECPKALILGSVIAARAYPDQVLAPVPISYNRDHPNKKSNAVYSNRFTSFKTKEIQNG